MRQSELFVSLKLKKDIDQLFVSGYNTRSKLFNSRYIFLPIDSFKNEKLNSIFPIHILWALQKKIGKAHYRNKMKRAARHVFFEVCQNFDQEKIRAQKKKMLLAFIPKKQFLEVPFESRCLAVKKLLDYLMSFQIKETQHHEKLK